MQATERSVREFLNAIIEHGNKTETNHRVAFVDYGADSSSVYSKAYLESHNTARAYNANGILTGKDWYKSSFISVSDTNTINKFLMEYSNVKRLHKGDTPTHKGFYMAQDLLKHKANVQGEEISRKELLVLFADGAPGNGKTIYEDWVEESKKTSDELKTDGVSIFTVGFYDNASSDSTQMDDSVGADYYARSNALFSSLATDKEKFFPAVGASALSSAFKKIAEQFAAEPVPYNEKIVMREEISKYFVLDCECETEHTCGLKVEIAECIGKNGNEFSFSTKPKPVEGIIVKKTKTNKNPVTDVVNVTGFDYGSEDNLVTEFITSEGTKYGGNKLILTVPIETRHGFWGGNNVVTNDSTTALYSSTDDYDPTVAGLEKLTRIREFPIPEANVPMTINIEAQDKTIYYAGRTVNATELVKGITAGYSEDSDEWVKPTTSVTVNTDGTLTPQAEWMDDYAKITWHSTSTKPDTEINNKNCGAYEYEVVMTPRNNAESAKENQSGHPGVNEAGGAIAGAAAAVNTTLSQAEATGNVHILIPTITFKDSVVDLGFETNADYYNATNRVKTITWNQLDTTHVEIPAVSGTEPTFAYAYTPASQEIFLDTPVDVVVSYEGSTDVTSDELMAVTTFNWETCDATVYHHETENISSHRGTETSYEFWIHTNDVYELPSTGGIGTYWYTIGGVVLMMGTSLMIYKKKREEVLRSR